MDTNVVLDVLARRDPHFVNSANVLAVIESGRASGYIAANTFTTIHYLLAKHLGPKKAAATLLDVSKLFRIEAVTHEILLQALSLGWKDFEDAVQAVCAVQCKADYLITRNLADFKNSPVPAISPAGFLALRKA